MDYVLGVDAVVALVNDGADPDLSRMSFSTLRSIFTCEYSSWSQVPGSTQTGPIFVIAHRENSGTTDSFVSRIGGFVRMPPDAWRSNYPCVNVCSGDGCAEIIGTVTALQANAIGYTVLPGLRSGNRDLPLCNDTNPPQTCGEADYVRQSPPTIRDGTYPMGRPLHMFHLESKLLPPAPSQRRLLEGAMNCACNCPLLAANGFLPVADEYCTMCTQSCP